MIENKEDLIKAYSNEIVELKNHIVFLENQLTLFSQKYQLSKKTRELYEYLSDNKKKIDRFGDNLGLSGINLIQSLTPEILTRYIKKPHRLNVSDAYGLTLLHHLILSDKKDLALLVLENNQFQKINYRIRIPFCRHDLEGSLMDFSIAFWLQKLNGIDIEFIKLLLQCGAMPPDLEKNFLNTHFHRFIFPIIVLVQENTNKLFNQNWDATYILEYEEINDKKIEELKVTGNSIFLTVKESETLVYFVFDKRLAEQPLKYHIPEEVWASLKKSSNSVGEVIQTDESKQFLNKLKEEMSFAIHFLDNFSSSFYLRFSKKCGYSASSYRTLDEIVELFHLLSLFKFPIFDLEAKFRELITHIDKNEQEPTYFSKSITETFNISYETQLLILDQFISKVQEKIKSHQNNLLFLEENKLNLETAGRKDTGEQTWNPPQEAFEHIKKDGCSIM